MAQDLEATTKKDDDAQERLKLYSIQLSQQADRMSEMRTQTSELEAQLECQSKVIEELRTQLSIKEELAIAPNTITSVGSGSGARIEAFPEYVPVGKMTGLTQIIWDTAD